MSLKYKKTNYLSYCYGINSKNIIYYRICNDYFCYGLKNKEEFGINFNWWNDLFVSNEIRNIDAGIKIKKKKIWF